MYRQCRNAYCEAVKEEKEKYSLKLASDLKHNHNLNPKKWWHIVKTMMGQNKQTQYPPLQLDDVTISDPELKANAFNTYFANQNVLCEEQATLPDSYPSFDQAKLDNIIITEEEVMDHLKGINTSKAVGPDLVSPRMLKEAGLAISSSLTRLFNLSLKMGVVPKMWKEASVIPIHKKKDKSDISNYRPVSLLSCVGKLQERIIFKHMYNYLHVNKLISPMQSGFRPGDSTINQLLDIYHTISNALDHKKDVRLVFCDISKAFDKVWHRGLLFKLRQLGISGLLLSWFTNYISDRRQKVSLQGHSSNWAPIKAGVPQGSVLGPLLFLIYINDIVREVKSNIRLFADDSTLYIEVTDAQVAADILNTDLACVSQWAKQWLVTFSPEKTTSMLCSLRDKGLLPTLYFEGTEIGIVNHHRHLGITLSQDISWQHHIDDIIARANKRLDVLCHLSYMLDRKTLNTMYTSFIRPVLDYGDVLYNGCTIYQAQAIELVQKRAARIITGGIRGTPTQRMYDELEWVTMSERRNFHCLCKYHSIFYGLAPEYLSGSLPPAVGNRTGRNLRNSANLTQFATRTSTFQRSFFPSTTRLWNSLDISIRSISSISEFKLKLMPKRHLNPLFSYGPRHLNIIWSRIRLGCSALRAQLYSMHIINDPTCNCGHHLEDAKHYFFRCPLYNKQRVVLLAAFRKFNLCLEVNIALYGSKDITDMENMIFVHSVLDYIGDTERFS